jgi:hypothetical protein
LLLACIQCQHHAQLLTGGFQLGSLTLECLSQLSTQRIQLFTLGLPAGLGARKC